MTWPNISANVSLPAGSFWTNLGPKLTLFSIYVKITLYEFHLVPKSETRGFDNWLTSSLRIECSFPLATSDVEMMSETKFYSDATNEQNK